MRKSLVFAILGLMLFGGLPSGVLSQSQTPVYTVDFTRSISGAPIQVLTAISVVNEGTASCPISVDWFFGTSPAVPACTTTLTLSTKEAFTHCSRQVGDTFVSCNVSCNPPLTFYQGRAVVGTTVACKPNIAVDARVYYTNSNDSQMTGVADVKVTSFTTPSTGY